MPLIGGLEGGMQLKLSTEQIQNETQVLVPQYCYSSFISIVLIATVIHPVIEA